jgi:hypothetical protein
MGLFGNTDDGLMETAIRLCWLDCKFFPSPAEIKQAIKNLQYNEQTEPKLQRLPPRSNWIEPKATEAFAVVKSGQAQAYLDSQDYSELAEYATLCVGKVSLELVKQCANEIQYAMEVNDQCRGCGYSDGKCPSTGNHPILYIRRNGWIDYEMKACANNRMEGTK